MKAFPAMLWSICGFVYFSVMQAGSSPAAYDVKRRSWRTFLAQALSRTELYVGMMFIFDSFTLSAIAHDAFYETII